LDATVPTFRRADVTREVDLIEEVARLGALDTLPATLPSRHEAAGRLTPAQRLRRQASDALTGQGLHEIVGWSFEGPEVAQRLRIASRPAVELQNPMSAEQSRLRTTLLGSLLEVARRNRARGAGMVRLFEAGAVYLPRDSTAPAEPYRVAALLAGPVRPPTWRDPEPPEADFFAAKGVLAGLLDTLRIPWDVVPTAEPEPFLHPGRAAQVMIGGSPAGWIGQIHPSVAAGWDWAAPLNAFEVDLDAGAQRVHATRYRDVTSFPEVREDLAVVVPDAVGAAQVLAVVRRAGAPLLSDAAVFDVYRDEERIGAGNVSLALRLHFRVPDRTLTDEEVAAKRKDIAATLAGELGGRIRDS
jgi:phenylalanyl-tRNA synthetase beta chain